MGESHFWKPFAQGVATPIVLIGGTNLLLKDFKVSNPYLYWGGLAASSAVVVGILADKIKVPILNAETFNAEGRPHCMPCAERLITRYEGVESCSGCGELKCKKCFGDNEYCTRCYSAETTMTVEHEDGSKYRYSETDPIYGEMGEIVGHVSEITDEKDTPYQKIYGRDVTREHNFYLNHAESFESEWVVEAVQQNLNDKDFVNYAYKVLIGGDAKTFEEKSMAIAETMNQNANNDDFTSFVESELFSAETFEMEGVYISGIKDDKRENRLHIVGDEDVDGFTPKEISEMDGKMLTPVEMKITKRLSKNHGAETFESPKSNPPYVIDGKRRIMTWKEQAREIKKEYDYPTWIEADKQIDYLNGIYQYLEECTDEEFEDWFRNIDQPDMSQFAFDYKNVFGNATDRDERMNYFEGYIKMLREGQQNMFSEEFYASETFNSDSHTDSFMADMPVNAVKNNDGWYIPSVHRNDYKETFKNWSPKAYPYEKRITQDSVNENCNSCGKDKVHYQFYLPRTNSRYPKIRFIDDATYCQYDTNTCGGNICGDCAEEATCENCGNDICSFCEEENNYDHSDLVCVDCREFNESLEDD